MNHRDRYGNLLGYVDICMNMLMAFVLLFAFAFMMIRLQESVIEKQSSMSMNSKMVLHLSWDNDSNDDIDLWAKTENPLAVVGFKSKASRNMFLDNDTLGKSSNELAMKDGKFISTYGNNEHLHFKECTETHVTVNAHYYRSYMGRPVTVKVELIRLDPLATLHSSTITLDKPGQERTVFQFDLSESCTISNLNDSQSLFILNKITGPGAN